MIESVKSISAIVATCSEFTAVVVIVVGALQAFGSVVKTLIEWKTAVSPLLVFRGFAGWLVLALEFLLELHLKSRLPYGGHPPWPWVRRGWNALRLGRRGFGGSMRRGGCSLGVLTAL